jgi:hypothetical protein
MFDSLVGIVSLCIALAQVAVLVSGHERRRTFQMVLAGLLILGIGYLVTERYRHYASIERLADEVTRSMSANTVQSVEQISLHINENRKESVSPSDLEAAIERNRAKGYLCSENRNATGDDGRKYLIRVYTQSGFGAC